MAFVSPSFEMTIMIETPKRTGVSEDVKVDEPLGATAHVAGK